MKSKTILIIWMVLKHASFVLLIINLSLSTLMANVGRAQVKSLNDISISISLSNATVKQALKAIEGKTDFIFTYSNEKLSKDIRIDLYVENETLATSLLSIAKQANLEFRRVNNAISVKQMAKKIPVSKRLIEVLETVISGTVTDENNEGIPGVNVLVKDTDIGTITDADGSYVLNVPDNATTLVFSYVGYVSEEVEIGERTTIDVRLVPDVSTLSEIVVIGYGTVKKSDLTGSVASLKSQEITATPTARLDDALRGKIAGLQVVPTSSAPGAAASIRIRGSNSVSANNEPLFVIDGFIGGGNLTDININDVESVEVLKDASATAIYGSRGSNGVILITTKRGSAGKARFSYDMNVSFQSPTRLLGVLNATEYAEWINEIKGITIYPDPASLGEGTDWQEEVYRDGAPMISHTLSLSGGNDKSRYFISGNYFDQDGIYIESNLKRWQFRVNTDHKVGEKLRIGNSLTLSRRTNTPRSSNIINIAGWDPTLPVRDADGNFTIQTVSSELSADNPVGSAMQNIDENTNTRILGNIFGEFEPIKGLKYKLSLGTNLNLFRRERYAPSTLFGQRNDQGTATINHEESLDLLIENTVSYEKEFGDHRVNALMGYTRQTIDNSSSNVQTQGFVTDAFGFDNLGAGTNRSAAGSSASKEGLQSYLFRANYAYKGKYLLTVSGRADGASVFAKNNQWGIFPSAAVAWRAGDEEFIQDLGIFDDLKVRASYGRLGNPGLDPGASLTRLAQGGNNYILGVNQQVVSGIAANALGNDNLKWESTNQFDIGVDMSFMDNRIQASVDYYSKRTDDLLVSVPILWLTSFANSLTNFGEVSNKGFELSLNSVNVDRAGFRWESNFNISTNKNEVVDIDAPEGFIFINPIGGVEAVTSGVLQEGEPIGTFYGMVQDGIWNSQAEIDESGLSGFSVFPGGKRYVDLNGDNVISEEDDREIIGDANPDFFGGFGNTLSYKGFELYFYWSFVVGNDIFNETDSRIAIAFDNNVPKRFADRWTPENTDTNVPSGSGVERPLITSNTQVLEDGSFLRLRNVSLAYNLPVHKLSWLQSARVYVSGTNLLLFDNYSGYDPEVSRGFSNLRRGYDQAQDPTVKMVTFGVTLDF